MDESLHDLKKKELAKRLAQLSQEYSAAWAQLGQALSSPDELRIKRMIEELEAKIREAETQCKALEPEPVPGASQSTTAPESRIKGRPQARAAGVTDRIGLRNFDLRVRQIGDDRYSVETNSELAGQAEVEVAPQAFRQAAQMVEATRYRSFERGRDAGSLLYDVLFPPLIRERFTLAQGRLLGGEGLRVRLLLDPPEVAALPWELMYNTAPSAPGFVALSPALSLVRFLPVSRRAQPVPRPSPLRLVLASAQPAGLPPLDVEAMAERILKELKPLQASIQVDILNHLSSEALAARAGDGFDALHFSGHAAFDESRQVGVIALENDYQQVEFMEAEVLAQLLDGSSVRLVFLNAVDTTRVANTGRVGGLAEALVGAGISSVVGWSGPVTDVAATRFAGEFYRGLARRLPLDSCMLYGRRTLYAQDPSGFEWSKAQLVTRAHDLNLLTSEEAN